MKGKKSKLHLAVAAAILAGVCGVTPKAMALPVGGNVVEGGATITTADKLMIITSKSGNNLITWHDFSIANGETVNFDDVNKYLNYVTGMNRSQIDGLLTGKTATVYLVNPNGIIFGDKASVDVGTLYLSTADLNGKLDSYANAVAGLSASGITFSGDVINKGTLKAAQTITVDGNNITFKNVVNVTATSVALKSNNAAHLGHAIGTAATGIDSTQYTNQNLTAPSVWTFKNKSNAVLNPIHYMLVRNGFELQNMKNSPDSSYMLANDIDANSITTFIPVGVKYGNNPFSGNFDGLGYIIKNLRIDKSDGNPAGLFGAISGVVENVGIEDSNIHGTMEVGAFAGFLVSRGEGTGILRNVYTSNTTVSGHNFVGGLVGQSWIGSDSTKVLIENVYNAATVKSDGKTTYYSDMNPPHYGGIVALGNNTIIKNAYNVGAIEATDSGRTNATVGGICGNAGANFEITNVYNVGTINAPNITNRGSIVGTKDASTSVNNAYYLDTTGTSNLNDVGESLSDIDMKKAASFRNWGISKDSSTNTIWRIYEDTTYPLLTAFMTPLDLSGYTVTYDGQNHNLALSSSIDTSLIYGYNTIANTLVTNYKNANTTAYTYSGISDLTSTQHGYNIKLPTNGTATLTINKKPLTITAGTATKTYDGTVATTNATWNDNKDYTLDADIPTGETATVTLTYDNQNVGTANKTVTPLAVIKNSSNVDTTANYDITYVKSTTNTITPKDVSVSFGKVSKVYDGTSTVGTLGEATFDGIVFGDTLTATGTAAYKDKNAGDKTVSYSGLTLGGSSAGNYNLTKTAYSGTGTITKAPLTVTFADITKTYDGTQDDTVETRTGTLMGIIADDASLGITASGKGMYDSKNVGNQNVTYSNIALSGNGYANYSIGTTATGKGIINKAPLTLTVVDFSKEYDGTTDAPGATYGMSGNFYDNWSGAAVYAFADKNVGTGKTLTLSGLSIDDGNNGDNYDFNIIPSTNSTITMNTPNAKVTLVEDQLEEAGSSMQQLQEATSVAATPETKAEELDTAATTQTTSGDSAGNNTNETVNTPTANDNTNTSMEWNGIGTVTMENNGINPPKSMSAEEVARQERGEE